MKSLLSCCLSILLYYVLTANAVVGAAQPYLQLPPEDTVTAPQGSQIVPNTFLRRWDPVTIFFAEDIGPKSPQAEDQAARFVTLSPSHPGAYTWINQRTLQFRPVEPWPPLTQFQWKIIRGAKNLASTAYIR
ncbi:Ig-like domain-containing protein [Kaarinaea lacus]